MRALLLVFLPSSLTCAVFNFDNLPASRIDDLSKGTVTPSSDTNAGDHSHVHNARFRGSAWCRLNAGSGDSEISTSHAGARRLSTGL